MGGRGADSSAGIRQRGSSSAYLFYTFELLRSVSTCAGSRMQIGSAPWRLIVSDVDVLGETSLGKGIGKRTHAHRVHSK